MLIPIRSIKPAADPIRKTWDEEKLNELAQSIAEQGLIVPIKVRPHPELKACRKHGFYTLATESDLDTQELSDCIWCGELQDKFWGEHEHAWFEYEEGEIEPARPFEVVYGHRRLEAMRRSGATEIECIVEGVDDTGALVQALIENVQREDMTLLDKARAFLAIKEAKGWSYSEMERRGISDRRYVANTIALLDEPQEIRDMIESKAGGATPTIATNILHDSRSLDPETRRDVIRKVQIEGLNERQGIKVVEAIKSAPSPEARRVLLETEFSTALHDSTLIKSRAQTYGAHDPLYRTDNGKGQQKTWDNAPEVKMIIDGVINAAKSWTTLIAEIRRMVEVGKMAPEGKQFTASKLRNLAQTLNSFADELEEEREREHA